MLTKDQIRRAGDIARQRQKKYTQHGGHFHGAHSDVERIGMLGEFGFSNFSGWPVDDSTRPKGDKGIDFTSPINGLTVDVKTYNKPFNLPHKSHHVANGDYADVFVLAKWYPTDQVDLLRWCYSKGIEDWPERVFDERLGIPSRYKPATQMEDNFVTLRRALGLDKPPVVYEEGMARIIGLPARFDFRDEVTVCWNCKGISRSGCPICIGAGLLAWA